MPGPADDDYRFDVAFSFAGKNRERIEEIATVLREELGEGRVFYDDWFKVDIRSGQMDLNLARVYGKESRLIVIALSEPYADRMWTGIEWEVIRALRAEADEVNHPTHRFRFYYLRFDDTDVPGFSSLRGYEDARKRTSKEIVADIHEQLRFLRESPMPRPAIATRQAVQPPILFFHPATNDAFYSRREKELDWLDGCAKDPNIRIATVTGVGGLGKTSLVGHWIVVRKGWQHRPFRGVFFYSFYSDRDADRFFAAFIKFVSEVLVAQVQVQNVRHHAAATLAQRWPFLIVLDGLEVFQTGAEDSRYGWINNGELNEFVSRLGDTGGSMLVLTSRFPFPEVTRQFPVHCHSLDLPLFLPREGADLLRNCGLPESQEDLMAYSGQFGGHPLALRLFAGASLAAPATAPIELSREVLRAEKVSTLPDPAELGIPDEERQRRRQRRQFQKLLEWLQVKLSHPKRRLLQLVALFREPVATSTLSALAAGLDAMKEDFKGCDAAMVSSFLDELSLAHLLQREDDTESDIVKWSAHPIVRDVFRDSALQSGEEIAAQFAQIVSGKGGTSRPAELRPILEAMEVLIASGDFVLANGLFEGRLENGKVFTTIPAPQEGLLCAEGFLRSDERRIALVRKLGEESLAFYQNAAALWGTHLGEMDAVERRFTEAAWIRHSKRSWTNVSIILQNLTEAQIALGKLREALFCANEALYYAGAAEMIDASDLAQFIFTRPETVPPREKRQQCNSLANRAFVLSLMGSLSAASRDFAAADALEREDGSASNSLYSIRGIYWCRYRLRLGETVAVRRIAGRNRMICGKFRWNNDSARCDMLLWQTVISANRYDAALKDIGTAVQIFREARLALELPDALLVQSRLRRQAMNLDAAFADCAEARRLAARSGFVLLECDALNLQASLRREGGDAAKAMDDAREALTIAERSGYYWGRHEALRQLRDVATALHKPADEKYWAEAETALFTKMQPEFKGALRINDEHDEAMENLYGPWRKVKGGGN